MPRMLLSALLAALALAVLAPGGAEAQAIPFEYIVQFKAAAGADVVAAHMAAVRASGALVLREYAFGSFSGYAVRLPAGTTLTDAGSAFLFAEEVALYEPNQIVRASPAVGQVNTPARLRHHHRKHPRPANTSRANADCNLQEEATWGLVRTAEQTLNIDGLYPWSSEADGAGVTVYIVDTGIYLEHSDFERRAVWGFDAVDDPSAETDDNGHGTHVAGTVMSKTYGIAKAATAVAVRVLGGDGSGTTAGVISGIQYVAQSGRGKKSVANMSLGGGRSTALNNAVAAAVQVGVPFVVAAGNEAQDACNTSPASEPSAISVACSTSTDAFCSFSNYGRCTDIVAPGMSITSTWINGPYSDNTISGTSMAAPHVAGVVAKLLSASATDLTPDQVQTQLYNLGNRGYVRNVPQPTITPNLLVHYPCPN